MYECALTSSRITFDLGVLFMVVSGFSSFSNFMAVFHEYWFCMYNKI